jgi:competence protein ComEC
VAAVAGTLTRVAVALLNSVAELAAELPAASIRVGAPSWIFLGAYVVALTALLSTSRRVRASGVLLLGALLVVALLPMRPSTGVLEINALDVGHGDAILLTLPDGGNVLVDGGGLPFGSFDMGESVVLPFLLDRGVRRLDAIVVTHADFDHIGGLTTVVNELGVDAIWQGGPENERRAYRELRERARERNVPIVTLTAGESFELAGAHFEVLSAGEGTPESSNNRSLVLRVGYGGRHVLLTGDAEDDLERRLVRSGMDLRADVLKLAHHGSRSSTSSAFLDAVQPQFAIVSARRNRSRPIPSALVLNRLRERGIEYARTDRNGTITVKIHRDGSIEVSTYRQSR